MPFSDIVAVSGLLLTPTTFMFNLAWPRLHEALEMDEKQSGPQARKRSREKVFDALLGCALPLTSAFMALCYANLLAAVCWYLRCSMDGSLCGSSTNGGSC